jgi:hypothetical protein
MAVLPQKAALEDVRKAHDADAEGWAAMREEIQRWRQWWADQSAKWR